MGYNTYTVTLGVTTPVVLRMSSLDGDTHTFPLSALDLTQWTQQTLFQVFSVMSLLFVLIIPSCYNIMVYVIIQSAAFCWMFAAAWWWLPMTTGQFCVKAEPVGFSLFVVECWRFYCWCWHQRSSRDIVGVICVGQVLFHPRVFGWKGEHDGLNLEGTHVIFKSASVCFGSHSALSGWMDL